MVPNRLLLPDVPSEPMGKPFFAPPVRENTWRPKDKAAFGEIRSSTQLVERKRLDGSGKPVVCESVGVENRRNVPTNKRRVRIGRRDIDSMYM